MRKFAAKALVLVLMLGIFVPTQFFASEISVTIDGVPVVFEGQGPTIVDGRTLVPVRGVFEQLGFDVDWEQVTLTATLTDSNYEVIITIGSGTFTTNGQTHPLDVPAQIIDGRTLLPIRAVLESVGYDVGWAQATSTVVVTSLGSTEPAGTPPPVMTIPNRRLTDGERQAWIDNYFALGGPSAFELEIVELVNVVRAQNGLSQVAIDDTLMLAARFYAQTMYDLNTGLGHNMGPYAVAGDTHGASRAVAEAFGGRLLWNGGNAGMGHATVQGQMNAWMASAGHERFILSAEHRYIGVGRFGSFSYLFLSNQSSLPTAVLPPQNSVQAVVSTPAPTPTPMPTPTPTPTPIPTQTAIAFNPSEFEIRVFELVNIERSNHGMTPVAWSNELANAARAHSIDLATTNTFSHASSDGTSLRERIAETGLVHLGAAENIGGGSTTPEAAMLRWMDSPDHRANILNPAMTHLGVGHYHLHGSQFEFYTTQKFLTMP